MPKSLKHQRPGSDNLGSKALLPIASLLAVLCFPSTISAQADAPALPAAAVPMSDEPPTPDNVTNARIQQLTEGGLIAKQAALSEGLLLMDRQLRQMQLVEQILAAYGPEAPVEISPGVFRSFRDSPAGMRQEIAYLDLQLQLGKKRAELEQTRTEGSGATNLVSVAANGTNVPVPDETLAATNGMRRAETVGINTISLEEVYGESGRYSAVVLVGGQRVTVRTDDLLADSGYKVVAVTRDRLTVELLDGDRHDFRIR